MSILRASNILFKKCFIKGCVRNFAGHTLFVPKTIKADNFFVDIDKIIVSTILSILKTVFCDEDN